MKRYSQFLNECIIKDLENKLKETSDADMRNAILRKIQQAKLSKKIF